MPEDTTLRAVAAVPLREDLCALIETLEPRVQMIRDHRLTAPMRGPADWSGDPDFTRTPEQQRAFDEMVDSADALFGIPDVDPAALARTVRDNPKLRWVMTTAAGGGAQVRAAQLDRAALDRIAFTTSAGVHGGPLAEFAVFGVLAGAKNLPRLIEDQQGRVWPDRWEMRQLDEMTVLVVGLGGIGAECARRFHARGAREWGTTRTATAVSLWEPYLDGAVVAIGNAPTALFHLLEMLLDGAPRPAAGVHERRRRAPAHRTVTA